MAHRAHEQIRQVWTPEHNVWLERQLWKEVRDVQRSLGLELPPVRIDRTHLACLAAVCYDDNTRRRIRSAELRLRHDLVARLRVFCEDAGHEQFHLGMTSADVVETVWQIRLQDSLIRLQELHGLEPWECLERYPLHGIKGPVGTQQDQVELLGSYEKAQELDRRVADRFGFKQVTNSIGQVNPRSLDLMVVSELYSRASALTESPNRPLLYVLSGFQTMVAGIAGDQWNEGDVASSIVRRVALPGAVFAFDVCLRGWF